MRTPHLHLVTPPRTAPQRNLYLTITLSDQKNYGLTLMRTREIINYTQVEPVSESPSYVRGIVSWEGRRVPVFDLALRLGLPGAMVTSRTCIVLVDGSAGSDNNFEAGLLVDAVNTVEDIRAAEIEAPQKAGSGIRTQFLAGTSKLCGRPLYLVDIDRVLSWEELPALLASCSVT